MDTNIDTFLYSILSLLWGFSDENLEMLMIWFQCRHSTGTSVLLEHISLHICETDLKHALWSQLLKLKSVDLHFQTALIMDVILMYSICH